MDYFATARQHCQHVQQVLSLLAQPDCEQFAGVAHLDPADRPAERHQLMGLDRLPALVGGEAMARLSGGMPDRRQSKDDENDESSAHRPSASPQRKGTSRALRPGAVPLTKCSRPTLIVRCVSFSPLPLPALRPSPAPWGGAPPASDAVARRVALIVGSRGNFCTGVALARDLVLTVAHCVTPGADYKLVEHDAKQQLVLRDV